MRAPILAAAWHAPSTGHEDVEALDVHDLEPTQHPYPLANVFRTDVVEEFDNRDAALAMGPEVEDDRFRVPPAHGEEP